MTTQQATDRQPTSKALVAVFWAYVLIPLAWGVINTLQQAVKLFG